jgi:hypothetical protein
MAMSMAEFIEKTGCEVVCDQMIVGIGPNRRMIGYVKEGTFTITDEGQELLAQLDGQPAPKRRSKKGEEAAEEPAAE